jgi:hypothetical protein
VESEDLALDSNALECEQSPSVKAMSTAVQSCESIGLMSHALMTCEHSKPPTSDQSMSSAVDSHAKTLARQAKVKASPESAADCGNTFAVSAANSNRNSRSSRTSAPFAPVDLSKFSGILPNSGLMRNGLLSARAQWVPHTHAIDCSLWPTPRADGGNNAGGSNSRRAAIKRGTYIPGSVNPSHREWLMGFPIGHTEIESWETQSFRRSLRLSGKQS